MWDFLLLTSLLPAADRPFPNRGDSLQLFFARCQLARAIPWMFPVGLFSVRHHQTLIFGAVDEEPIAGNITVHDLLLIFSIIFTVLLRIIRLPNIAACHQLCVAQGTEAVRPSHRFGRSQLTELESSGSSSWSPSTASLARCVSSSIHKISTFLPPMTSTNRSLLRRSLSFCVGIWMWTWCRLDMPWIWSSQ